MSLLDRGSAAHLLHDLMDDLLDGQDPALITQATLAFAGIGRARERAALGQILAGTRLQNFSLMTDADIQYEAVFGKGRGMLLSAGTGSICLVKDPRGALRQFGGRGYLLGDEGSGYHMGNLAIRTALEHLSEGLRESDLTRQILSFYGLQDREELISFVYSTRHPQRMIASCAMIVMKAAENGFPDAREIVDQAAEKLELLFRRGAKLFGNGEEVPLCLSGGVLKGQSPLRRNLENRLKRVPHPIRPVPQELNSAAAAVIHAIESSGEKVSSALKERLLLVNI